MSSASIQGSTLRLRMPAKLKLESVNAKLITQNNKYPI
jgi:hypothetical protein